MCCNTPGPFVSNRSVLSRASLAMTCSRQLSRTPSRLRAIRMPTVTMNMCVRISFSDSARRSADEYPSYKRSFKHNCVRTSFYAQGPENCIVPERRLAHPSFWVPHSSQLHRDGWGSAPREPPEPPNSDMARLVAQGFSLGSPGHILFHSALSAVEWPVASGSPASLLAGVSRARRAPRPNLPSSARHNPSWPASPQWRSTPVAT